MSGQRCEVLVTRLEYMNGQRKGKKVQQPCGREALVYRITGVFKVEVAMCTKHREEAHAQNPAARIEAMK